jgi:hypothetical protein
LGYYGAFSDSTTQIAGSTTTAYVITLNTTDEANGVSIVSGSRLTVANAGTYNIQWSGQLQNTSTQEHDAFIWIQKNGVDVAGSTGMVSVPASHGGTYGHTITSWNYIETLAANDYIQFYWSTNNTQISIVNYPARVTPTRPSTASVIVTFDQVMYTQLGPTGATGPTGPMYGSRVVTVADATSVTLNADTTDIGIQTNTQAVGTLTINAPSGTPTNGQKIMFRLQATNAQTFNWNIIFSGSADLSLPTVSSSGSKYDYMGFIYNSIANKWQLLARVFGF